VELLIIQQNRGYNINSHGEIELLSAIPARDTGLDVLMLRARVRRRALAPIGLSQNRTYSHDLTMLPRPRRLQNFPRETGFRSRPRVAQEWSEGGLPFRGRLDGNPADPPFSSL